jgi:hypothetical protein
MHVGKLNSRIADARNAAALHPDNDEAFILPRPDDLADLCCRTSWISFNSNPALLLRGFRLPRVELACMTDIRWRSQIAH